MWESMYMYPSSLSHLHYCWLWQLCACHGQFVSVRNHRASHSLLHSSSRQKVSHCPLYCFIYKYLAFDFPIFLMLISTPQSVSSILSLSCVKKLYLLRFHRSNWNPNFSFCSSKSNAKPTLQFIFPVIDRRETAMVVGQKISTRVVASSPPRRFVIPYKVSICRCERRKRLRSRWKAWAGLPLAQHRYRQTHAERSLAA